MSNPSISDSVAEYPRPENNASQSMTMASADAPISIPIKKARRKSMLKKPRQLPVADEKPHVYESFPRQLFKEDIEEREAERQAAIKMAESAHEAERKMKEAAEKEAEERKRRNSWIKLDFLPLKKPLSDN